MKVSEVVVILFSFYFIDLVTVNVLKQWRQVPESEFIDSLEDPEQKDPVKDKCYLRLKSRHDIRSQYSDAMSESKLSDEDMTFNEYNELLEVKKGYPKIVHSVWGLWDDAPPPFKVKESWEIGDWQFIFHSKRDAINLVEDHFEWLLPLYRELTKIQKADLLRYLFVYHYGGLYVDADCMNTKELDPTEILMKYGFDPVRGDNFFAVKEHLGGKLVKNLYYGADNGGLAIRNGVGELPLRIANYAFYGRMGSPVLFNIILRVIYRSRKLHDFTSEELQNIDQFYSVLYSTGPDAVTESVWGGPSSTALSGVVFCPDSSLFLNMNNGNTWKVADNEANRVD